MPDLTPDEKKFAYFWIIVFGSAVAFWSVAVHYAVGLVSRLLA